MGFVIAFIVIAIGVAALVGGAVLHPLLYGMLIAAFPVVPFWLGSSIVDGIISALFGKRR